MNELIYLEVTPMWKCFETTLFCSAGTFVPMALPKLARCIPDSEATASISKKSDFPFFLELKTPAYLSDVVEETR